MEKIKVLIADDHPLLREGLTKVLSLDEHIDIVGQAENGQDAILKTKELKPQVILMDINMPVMDGIEATKQIKREFPEISIIALTVADDNDQVFEVMKAGVTGYVLKDIDPDVLVANIKAVNAGETVIHPKVTNQIFHQFDERGNKNTFYGAKDNEALTDREIEILQLMSEGKHNKDIASTLFISEKTVKNHITNIFKKIKVTDRTQAVLFAIKAKLVKVVS